MKGVRVPDRMLYTKRYTNGKRRGLIVGTGVYLHYVKPYDYAQLLLKKLLENHRPDENGGYHRVEENVGLKEAGLPTTPVGLGIAQ